MSYRSSLTGVRCSLCGGADAPAAGETGRRPRSHAPSDRVAVTATALSPTAHRCDLRTPRRRPSRGPPIRVAAGLCDDFARCAEFVYTLTPTPAGAST